VLVAPPRQTHQLDEQDALDEEKEAIRLQKKHAEELNEEDFALGVGAPATKVGKSAVTPSKAGAKGTASLDVEQIQKSADLLTKDEKLKMVAEGTPLFARCLLCVPRVMLVSAL
jgi:hypothetical protein